jgi:hypothetical protein
MSNFRACNLKYFLFNSLLQNYARPYLNKLPAQAEFKLEVSFQRYLKMIDTVHTCTYLII